eukprot:snap_masked-scaffold_11-processed-gene-8.5-mRNA-1 protein AED:1.00 eAED:1.00 QI:0/-1/0/0/-1/1/1/0/334
MWRVQPPLNFGFEKDQGGTSINFDLISPTKALLEISDQLCYSSATFSDENHCEIRSVSNLDVSIEWLGKKIQEKDFKFLRKLFSGLSVHTITFARTGLGKPIFEKLLMMILSEIKTLKGINIWKSSPRISSSIFFRSIKSKNNIDSMRIKDLIPSTSSKLLTDFLKSNGSLLSNVKFDINRDLLFSTKFSSNFNIFPRLTSLSLDFEPVSRKVFISAIYYLATGPIFEKLTSFQLNFVTKMYLTKSQLYVLFKLLCSIQRGMVVMFNVDLFQGIDSSLLLSSLFWREKLVLPSSEITLSGREDGVRRRGVRCAKASEQRYKFHIQKLYKNKIFN